MSASLPKLCPWRLHSHSCAEHHASIREMHRSERWFAWLATGCIHLALGCSCCVPYWPWSFAKGGLQISKFDLCALKFKAWPQFWGDLAAEESKLCQKKMCVTLANLDWKESPNGISHDSITLSSFNDKTAFWSQGEIGGCATAMGKRGAPKSSPPSAKVQKCHLSPWAHKMKLSAEYLGWNLHPYLLLSMTTMGFPPK